MCCGILSSQIEVYINNIISYSTKIHSLYAYTMLYSKCTVFPIIQFIYTALSVKNWTYYGLPTDERTC